MLNKKILVVSNIYPSKEFPQKGTFVKNAVKGLSKYFCVDTVCLENSAQSKIGSYFRFYYRCFKSIITGRYDIVYVHYVSHSSLPVIFAGLLRKFKFVSHVHGSDVLCEDNVSTAFFLLKKFIANIALRRSDWIISPSDYYKNEIICRHYDVSRKKVVVSPSGGVDLSVFHDKDTPSFNTDALTLGYVGRLTKDKGVLDFIEIFHKIERYYPSVKAIIVGDGPLRAEVEKSAKKSKIEYFSSMPQSNLQSIYSKLDLFIFPTKRRTESLGLVGLEAMACGVPVLAYDIGGPKYYIDDKVDGYLVPVGDIRYAVDVIIDMCNDELSSKLQVKRAAIEKAKTFDSKVVNNELTKFFNGIVNE